MRDPDLMQRADRAAIALEQAWERWRAMHGLGAEPLPPVSSYVGYSLEEPWGQPRVVFGLRADEAELLASLLEGHDCVGSVYAGVGARRDWRLPVSGQASLPSRGYGGPLGVPAQAPPPGIDLLSPGLPDGFAVGRLPGEDVTVAQEQDDDRELRESTPNAPRPSSARSRAVRQNRTSRRTPETPGGNPEETAQRDGIGWPAADSEALPAELSASAEAAEPDGPDSSPLEPLPDEPDLSVRADDEVTAEPAADGASAASKPAGGPGYRGPRYQGFPPRYDASPTRRQSSARSAASHDDDEDDADLSAEPAAGRKSHVAKLSRSTRRRTQGSG